MTKFDPARYTHNYSGQPKRKSATKPHTISFSGQTLFHQAAETSYMKKRVLPGLVMNTEEDRVNWKRKKYSSELSTIIKEKQKEMKEEELREKELRDKELSERELREEELRERDLRELREKSVLLGGGEGHILDSDGFKELSKDLNSLDWKLEGWIAEMDIGHPAQI